MWSSPATTTTSQLLAGFPELKGEHKMTYQPQLAWHVSVIRNWLKFKAQKHSWCRSLWRKTKANAFFKALIRGLLTFSLAFSLFSVCPFFYRIGALLLSESLMSKIINGLPERGERPEIRGFCSCFFCRDGKHRPAASSCSDNSTRRQFDNVIGSCWLSSVRWSPDAFCRSRRWFFCCRTCSGRLLRSLFACNFPLGSQGIFGKLWRHLSQLAWKFSRL